MKKISIVVIDSGVSKNSRYLKNIKMTLALKQGNDGENSIIEESPKDFIGHGTAVIDIICSENPDVNIISVRICENEIQIGENELAYVLQYIYENLEVDLINISAGITYLQSDKILKNICKKLLFKGVLIIAAFDNDGAITYPAAFDEVIGVDVLETRENKIWIKKNSIVDVYIKNKYYRTYWLNKRTVVRGTSFATAYFTGVLSKKISDYSKVISKEIVLKDFDKIENKENEYYNLCGPEFEIKKAIVFPINKESDVLLRFKENLPFDINGVYDIRVSGKIGREMHGFKVENIENISWNDEFDTIILSCCKDLSEIAKKDYVKYILDNALKYKKNIYSFEADSRFEKYKNVYFPSLIAKNVPYHNEGKLHRICTPCVSVFGTSSKQGKYSLQIRLKKAFNEYGYSVGLLATEPSGYLFGAETVYHFGYNFDFNLNSFQSIAILNEMLWNIQKLGNDLILTGCQSGMRHYDNLKLQDFHIKQYSFGLGVMPDFSILCVNPHDEIEYIKKTIYMIDSLSDGRVEAIVLFPIKAVEMATGIQYKLEQVGDEELSRKAQVLQEIFDLPVYINGNDNQIQILTKQIVDFFSTEENMEE